MNCELNSWTLSSEFYFLYDGWNLVEEIRRQGATETSRYFVWGLDLSQSLEGAGGVGGLLAMLDGTDTYQYCYDGNGNVVQMIDAADGTVVAQYEYAPFGSIIHKNGPMADDNPFKFSTKYYDAETGLYYYGYRYYSSEMGRWVSRDPVQEYGGINIYVYVVNDPINKIDLWGLELVELPDSELEKIPGPPPEKSKPMKIDIGNCGSTIIQRALIPDAPFTFDFSDCCQDHDECYGDCDSTKKTCDDEFLNCMIGKVNEQDRWYTPGGLGKVIAHIFQWSVDKFGCKAYKAAQRANNCCPITCGDKGGSL